MNALYFPCHLCPKKYSHKGNLQRHISENHEGIPRNKKDDTQRPISAKKSFPPVLQKHELTHKRFECTTCKVKFKDEKSLSFHVSSHEDPLSYYKCPKCNKRFGNKGERDSHMRVHENGVRKFSSCNQCKKIFKFEDDLKKHMLESHNSLKTSPDHCHKSTKIQTHSGFIKRDSQEQNVIHTNSSKPKRHQCKVCGREFPTSGNLSRHKLVHERNIFVYCKFCKRRFRGQSNLDIHIIGCAFSLKTKTDGNNCAKFSHLSDVKISSQKIFTGGIQSCTADKKDNSIQDTRPRYTSAITETKPLFVCHVCSKCFRLKSSYEEHLKVHRDHLCYACVICKGKFPTQTKLKSHICSTTSSNDNNQKKLIKSTQGSSTTNCSNSLACNICGKVFKYKQTLIDHISTHRDHLPYRCNVCASGFSTQTKLRTHVCEDDSMSSSSEKEVVKMENQVSMPGGVNHQCIICSKSVTDIGDSEADHTHVMVMLND